MRTYAAIADAVRGSFLAPVLRPPVRVARKVLEKYRNATARVNPRLVLVVAHPRSGTTAVATLLAQHAGLRAFTQTGPWTMADKDIVTGRITMEEVIAQNRYAFSCDVMSAADAGCFLGVMKAALPAMRIVFLVRDPRDMICSVIERINNFDVSTFRIDDLNYRYFNVDWLGINEKDHVKRLALRWNRWLEEAKSVEGVLFQRYEDFLENKPRFIGAVATELGLPSRCDITGNMNRQMSKEAKNMPIRGAGRWRNLLPSEVALAVEEICKEGMAEFAYEPAAATLIDADADG